MRFLIAIAIAGLVNLGLFLLMSFMAAGQQRGPEGIETATMVDFVRLKRESAPPEPKERQLPKKPPPPEEPPSMMMPRPQAPQPKPSALAKVTPHIELPLSLKSDGPYLGDYGQTPGTSLGSGIVPAGEGDLLPLVRISPQYPRRAARRGLEGSVTVAFIITKEGSVRDPKVIESHPSGIFEQAALQAIKRWKFKPKQIEGQLVEQRATQEIEFNLAR
ncbi:energy transducer TonB [Nitrosococcus oceani]|uniref:Protein TonB n=2 Tax=Nitrosococcus oceani TaxID=1229 RepID=Q3JDG7_NITOC|nr:energy transducer TonB [Nitrosococcus oceani]KFI20390.1 energy transducer TonB [Nitrosococcus oceani C-27]ABA57129.1 outer membrane transport energization protein TonB [Nitrosococcus oceani ATCC 19707]EDZ65915.1 TonB family C-terminal domain protein [Nitrosococcus oceani AFC27]KFI23540.1 energy transducer TonB [Nitrosococcus oceani]GEM19851.1 cell envelope biogenesis protein TonB [Nitrosococcus oceani]